MRGTISPGIESSTLCRRLCLALCGKVAGVRQSERQSWEIRLGDSSDAALEISRSRQSWFSSATLVRHHVEKAKERKAEVHSVSSPLEAHSQGLFSALCPAA